VGGNHSTSVHKKWHQTWVDISGGLSLLDGELVDSKIALAGNAPPDAQGDLVIHA
jgi:hypothetical protein